MNTNTFWFRVAQSIAALWVFVVGFQAWNHYGDLLKSQEMHEYDSSRYDQCSREVLVPNAQPWTFRPPTFAEMESCRRIIDKVEADFLARMSLWDKLRGKLSKEISAGELLFYRGLLPMGALLLFVAWWSKLKVGAKFCVKLYVDWLKSGWTKQG